MVFRLLIWKSHMRASRPLLLTSKIPLPKAKISSSLQPSHKHKKSYAKLLSQLACPSPWIAGSVAHSPISRPSRSRSIPTAPTSVWSKTVLSPRCTKKKVQLFAARWLVCNVTSKVYSNTATCLLRWSSSTANKKRLPLTKQTASRFLSSVSAIRIPILQFSNSQFQVMMTLLNPFV